MKVNSKKNVRSKNKWVQRIYRKIRIFLNTIVQIGYDSFVKMRFYCQFRV